MKAKSDKQHACKFENSISLEMNSINTTIYCQHTDESVWISSTIVVMEKNVKSIFLFNKLLLRSPKLFERLGLSVIKKLSLKLTFSTLLHEAHISIAGGMFNEETF